MDLVQVSLSDDGSALFTCRVCGEHCPAPAGVPLDQATREFLAMHPACADPDWHEEGCPADPETDIGAEPRPVV